MSRIGRWWSAVVAACVCLLPVPAWAESRIALLIGNTAYKGVSELVNPKQDVALLAEALGKAGFRVRVETDLSGEGMRRTLRDFAADAERADWAVVYYAGHGLEMGGQNFLVPVDARLQSDRDVPFETVALDQVLQSVEGARKLRLVIVDACRNNPFADQIRTSVTRSATRGLARVEPQGGTLVAYAAKVGQVALDGDGRNSPFVTALAKAVTTQGLELNKVFRAVRDDVLKTTGRRQEPYVYGSLPADDFYFLPPAQAGQAAPAGDANAAADRLAQQDFLAARTAGTREGWDKFLARYDKGFYADLARAERDRLLELKPAPGPSPQVVAAAPSTPAVTVRDSHPTSAMSATESYLRGFSGGDCFAARPMGPASAEAGAALRVEAFGPAPAPFNALDDDFKARFGNEAEIRARLVTTAQCGAVRLLKTVSWGREQGPQIFQARTLLRPGQPLSAVVSNAGSRTLAFVVVSDDGTVYDLTSALRRRNDLAVLSMRPFLPASSLEKPQIALAIATDRPLKVLASAGQAPAKVPLPMLIAELESLGSAPAIAATYWRTTAASARMATKPWTP